MVSATPGTALRARTAVASADSSVTALVDIGSVVCVFGVFVSALVVGRTVVSAGMEVEVVVSGMKVVDSVGLGVVSVVVEVVGVSVLVVAASVVVEVVSFTVVVEVVSMVVVVGAAVVVMIVVVGWSVVDVVEVISSVVDVVIPHVWCWVEPSPHWVNVEAMMVVLAVAVVLSVELWSVVKELSDCGAVVAVGCVSVTSAKEKYPLDVLGKDIVVFMMKAFLTASLKSFLIRLQAYFKKKTCSCEICFICLSPNLSTKNRNMIRKITDTVGKKIGDVTK